VQNIHSGCNNIPPERLDRQALLAQSRAHTPLEQIMSDIIQADQLRLLIERIERLEEEKKGIADDIKDVYSEAKSVGYDVKTMRQVVRLRKLERHVREEAEALLDTYKTALGLA
jgi:uncharacterized protein (UPF0335 family)